MISLQKIKGLSALRIFLLGALCAVLSGCEPPRPASAGKTVVDNLLLLDAVRAGDVQGRTSAGTRGDVQGGTSVGPRGDAQGRASPGQRGTRALTAGSALGPHETSGGAAGQRIVAVGEYGYVVISDDDGATWRLAKSPAQSTLTAVAFADDRHGWAVGHDAVILRSADGGETWEQTYSAPDKEAPLLNLWFENAEHGYAFGAYGTFYETGDGGKTWNPRKVLEGDGHINAMARTGAGQLFLAGEAGTLYRSGDNGQTWKALVSPYRGSYFGALGLPDGGILIFGLRGHAFRSGDGGDTWTSINTGTEGSLLGGKVLANGSVVLLGGEGNILVSRDSAKTFTRLKHPENKTLIAAVAVGTSKILAFGEPGAHKTEISLEPAKPPLKNQ